MSIGIGNLAEKESGILGLHHHEFDEYLGDCARFALSLEFCHRIENEAFFGEVKGNF